ncbi:hypothetical protein DLV35_10345 [Escherichia coli]|nr:hypothetical protein [Escherichia coli]EGE3722027.1 hypothetical protein [Escherichia coli]
MGNCDFNKWKCERNAPFYEAFVLKRENYSKTIIAENNMSRFMCLLYILYLSLAQRDIALLCQRFTHGALAQNCGKKR